MSAVAILSELTSRGISIRVVGFDKLRLNPQSRLDDQLKAAVLQHKPELLRLLTEESETITLAATDPGWSVSATTLTADDWPANTLADWPDPCARCGRYELWQAGSGDMFGRTVGFWRCRHCDPPPRFRNN